MDIRKQILTQNECFLIAKRQTVKGVLWHSTGANNPKLSRYVPDDGNLGVNPNNNHWNQFRPGGRQVCVHAFIGKDKNGDVRVYQTLPFEMQAWGSGKGVKGSANSMGYIQFEICEDDLKDPEYFKKAYQAGVEFTAQMSKTFNFEVTNSSVIDHSTAYDMGIGSNHSDVMHWFKLYGKTMDSVRTDTKALLNVKPVNVVAKPTEKLIPLNGILKVVYNGEDGLNVRTSPEYGKNVSQMVHKNEVFTVVGIIGDFYKLKSGLYITNTPKLVEFKESPSFKVFKVKINAVVLNIREGAGTQFKISGSVGKGDVYTIVAEKNGWGELRSGMGWIKLEYTTTV